MEGLRKEQQKLQDSLTKLGDPQALQSQADAASNMARTLAESGNMDLAGQFAEQAQAMSEQAKEAGKQKAQLDKVDAAIQKQGDAIERLQRERDQLSQTYDLEKEKLDLIEQGYRAVEQAIKDNQTAADNAAQSARKHLDELEAARKAAESAAKAAGKGAKSDPFAQFDAAGGANLPDMVGDLAIPGPPPKGGADDWDAYLADLNKRTGDRMAKLFPNPFGMVNDWLSKAKSAWSVAQGWIDSLFGGGGSDFSGMSKRAIEQLSEAPKSDRWAAWATPIRDALKDIKEAVASFNLDGLREKFEAARKAVTEGFGNALDKVREPFERLRVVAAKILGFIMGALLDVAKIIIDGVMDALGILADFGAKNGREIGTIVGVVIGFFADWYALLAEIGLWVAEKLWPIFRWALSGIGDLIRGLANFFAGFFQMIIQLLTGDFSAAWDGFLQMLKGIGQILMGIGKLLIGAILAFALWLVGTGIGLIGEGLMGILPLVAKVVLHMGEAFGKLVLFLGEQLVKLPGKILEHAPGMVKALGDAVSAMVNAGAQTFKGLLEDLFKVGDWFFSMFQQYAPRILKDFVDIIKALPGAAWDAFKWAFNAYFDLVRFVASKISEWAPNVTTAFVDMLKALPQKMWDGFKAMWNQLVDFSAWIGTKVAGYSTAVWDFFVNMFKAIPSKAWAGFKETFRDLWLIPQFIAEKVGGWAPSVWNSFTNLARAIPGKMWDGLVATWTKAFPFAKTVTDTVAQSIWDVGRAAGNLGRDIIAGIVAGIRANAWTVMKALGDMAQQAWDGVKSFFHIGSPSKLMRDTVGKWLPAGVAEGVDANAHMVSDSMVAMAESAYNQLAAMQAASLNLPTLTQNVALNYLNDPLTSLGGVSGGVNGSTLRGVAEASGQQVYAPHIEVTATPAESQDPMALAQTLSWALRTSVG
jgi:phage-related protein